MAPYQKRHAMFRSSRAISQTGMDSLQMLKETEEEAEPLPKGLDPITLNLIRQTMQNLKIPQSAQQIAEHLQLSRITIRKKRKTASVRLISMPFFL